MFSKFPPLHISPAQNTCEKEITLKYTTVNQHRVDPWGWLSGLATQTMNSDFDPCGHGGQEIESTSTLVVAGTDFPPLHKHQHRRTMSGVGRRRWRRRPLLRANVDDEGGRPRRRRRGAASTGRPRLKGAVWDEDDATAMAMVNAAKMSVGLATTMTRMRMATAIATSTVTSACVGADHDDSPTGDDQDIDVDDHQEAQDFAEEKKTTLDDGD